MSDFSDARAARERFPAGLFQPAQGFRFGEDALLLATLGARVQPRARRVIELGAGCGAALLGCLLLLEDAQGLGLEMSRELVDCAEKNAALLDLSARFACLDLADRESFPKSDAALHDLALANPPWFLEEEGRRGAIPLREGALRAKSGALKVFFAAAAYFLRPRGHFCLILRPHNLPDAFAAASEAGFGLRFLQPIKSAAPGVLCKRAFLVCRKGAKHDLALRVPLAARAARGGEGSQPWPMRALDLKGMS